MIGPAVYKKAKYNTASFNAGKVYLYLGPDSDDRESGKYISKHNQITSASNDRFEQHTRTEPIKDVVCIYPGRYKHLTIKERYSVYKLDIENKDKQNGRSICSVIDDAYEKLFYPSNYFINIDEYEKLERDGLIDSFIKDKAESMNKEQETSKLNEENKKLANERNRIICSIIRTTAESDININGFNFKNSGSSNKNIFIRVASLFNTQKKDTSQSNLKKSMYLEKLNLMPAHILGKVKIIENNIFILHTMDIHSEILKLIQESINLAATLLDFNSDETSSAKEETARKLEEFLNNVINYCNTLKINKDVENNYIKRKLAENINDAIDRNSEVFKNMIKDGNILQKHFK